MKPLSTFSLRLLLTWMVLVLAIAAEGQEPKKSEAKLKGKKLVVEDSTWTAVNVPSKELLPCLLWGNAQGTTLYALDQNGVLRKIKLPEFTEELEIDLQNKCDWLSISSQGLVVTVSGKQEVWLLDSETLAVKKKMTAATVKQAVSAANLSVAYVTNGKQLATLDLVKGKVGAVINGEWEGLAVTPNGGYLLACNEKIHRYKISKTGTLKPEESGPAIADGRRGSGLMVSPDSELVSLPTGGGNRTGLPLHPPAKAYSTFIYPVKNLKKPECLIEQGGYPEVVGYDPAAKLIYSQSADFPLMVFNYGGISQKTYRPKNVRDVRQYLTHPEGRKLLVLTKTQLYWVELPK